MQKIFKLVLLLRYERTLRVTASCEPVLACIDLFALATLAVALLVLTQPQIKNGSVCVVALGITETTEQRLCIKFCENLGKTCAETYDIIKMAFGENSMSRTHVFQWFRCFEEG